MKSPFLIGILFATTLVASNAYAAGKTVPCTAEKFTYNLYGSVSEIKTNGTTATKAKTTVSLYKWNAKTKKFAYANVSTTDKKGNYGFTKLDSKTPYMVKITSKGYETYQYQNVCPRKRTDAPKNIMTINPVLVPLKK